MLDEGSNREEEETILKDEYPEGSSYYALYESMINRINIRSGRSQHKLFANIHSVIQCK